MSLPLPGYVRRRRSCADSRRISIVVRRPGMRRRRVAVSDSTRPRRGLLPRPRLTGSALPSIAAARRGPLKKYWSTRRMFHCHLPRPPPLQGGRGDDGVRACLLRINILFCPSRISSPPRLLSSTIRASLCSGICQKDLKIGAPLPMYSPYPIFMSMTARTDNSIVLFLSNLMGET